MNTLEENAGLRDLVLEAKLEWGRLLGEMETNKKATTRLMSLLPHIQTLQLLPGHIYFTTLPPARITSLELFMPQREIVSMEMIETLLSNPFLRNLYMMSIQSWSWEQEVPEEAHGDILRFKSHISHLAVSSNICSGNVMETILRSPAALVSLHYRYNGKVYPCRNAIMPSNFPAPLMPHRTSLEELVIYAQPHQHITSQHPLRDVMGTMREYISIKRLGLPAWWMVNPNSDSRDHSIKLVEMLPPKLETLQVQLAEVRLNCRNPALFAHLARLDNVEEHYRQLLLWLGEIATWKQDYIPRLKEVIVWSYSPKLPHEDRMLHDARVEESFLEQGVHIRFIVCRPDSSMLFGINAGL